MKTFSQFLDEQLLLEVGMFARLHHPSVGYIELDNTQHSDDRKDRKEHQGIPVSDEEVEALVKYCFPMIMDDYEKGLIQRDERGYREVALRDYRTCLGVILGMYLGQDRFSRWNNRYGVNKIFVKTVMRQRDFTKGQTKWIIDVKNNGSLTHTKPVPDSVTGLVPYKEVPSCWDEKTQSCTVAKKEPPKEPVALSARKALADWLGSN